MIEKKVFIIMPISAFEEPAFFCRALSSVIEQSHKNWHLHVHFQNSSRELELISELYLSDYSEKVSFSYGENINSFIFIESKKLEASSYIVLHDTKSTWNSRFLEKTTAFLEKKGNKEFGAVVAAGEVVFEHLNGNEIYEEKRIPLKIPEHAFGLIDYYEESNITPASLLISKEAYNKTNKILREDYRLNEIEHFFSIISSTKIGTITGDALFFSHKETSRPNGRELELDRKSILDDALRIYSASTHGGTALAMLIMETNINLRNYILKTEKAIREKLDWMHWDVNFSVANDIESRVNSISNRDKDSLKEEINRMNSLLIDDSSKIGGIKFRFGSGVEKEIFISNLVFTVNAAAKMIRPIYWIWRKLLPIRKLVLNINNKIRGT